MSLAFSAAPFNMDGANSEAPGSRPATKERVKRLMDSVYGDTVEPTIVRTKSEPSDKKHPEPRGDSASPQASISEMSQLPALASGEDDLVNEKIDVMPIPTISPRIRDDRIDYIVHMLEESRNERTDSAVEEIVLYSFIGVFVIFVLDAFARNKKM